MPDQPYDCICSNYHGHNGMCRHHNTQLEAARAARQPNQPSKESLERAQVEKAVEEIERAVLEMEGNHVFIAEPGPQNPDSLSSRQPMRRRRSLAVDSLRSIAEGMVHQEGRLMPSHALTCPACRLLALCDAAEKTDLVQKLRTPIDYVSCLGDTATVANQVRAQIADELATWLAARPLTFTVSTAPMDLTGHAPECELWGATAPICSAIAMDGMRKVVFTCTCGKWPAARGIQP